MSSTRTLSAWLVLVALLCGGAACRYQPSPVTLRGSPPEIAALAGEWGGEYSGAQSGRSGSIQCRVTTSFTGTVQGDVIEGTFATRGSEGLEQSGRWRVTRGRS